MKKIKVLFVIGNLDVGGAEKLVINQIKNIDKNRFEPHLLTLFPLGKNNYGEPFSEGTLYKKIFFRGPFDIVSWIKTCQYLRQEKFDIICSHLFESNFIIRVCNLFAGKKSVFIFEHNIYWQKRRWKVMADKFLAPWTAKIFVDSKAVLDFTSKQEKIEKNKFAVLPYPIDLTNKISSDDILKIKKEFGLPSESFVVGSVARFVEQKGQSYLIRAAAETLKKTGRSDIFFLLVGYGKMENDLKKLRDELGLGGKVIICPARNIKEVLPIFHIFVVSSLWEGQPIAMLEAFASGVPVVATSVGGIPEVLTDGGNGLLVKAQDVELLSEAIIRLLNDGDLRKRLGREAAATAENYGLPVYIKKLEKFFIEEFQSKNI